mgnify:FL=1
MKDFYYYRPRRKHLTKRDEIIVNKILELANLVGVALVFGQFLGYERFALPSFVFGLFFLLVVYVIGWYYLSRFNAP